MKRVMTVSMIAFGFLLMASCSPANRVVQGGESLYYSPMYYGTQGYYYYPGFYPRTNIIVQQNRVQPGKRLVVPRSNRRPATVLPQNRRDRNTSRPTVQPRIQPRNAPGKVNRHSAAPGRRNTVAPSRRTTAKPAQRSAPSGRRENNK